jgi:hypothetical protein
MAALREQSIPPDFVERYRRALGVTKPIPYPGPHHPLLEWAASKKYKRYLASLTTASPLQIAQRAVFKAASNAFYFTTEQERRAYYRLSKIIGITYRNFFLSRTILAFLDGMTWSQLARPTAFSLMTHMDYTYGGVFIYLPDKGARNLVYDIETDPATDGYAPYDCSSGTFSIVHRWWNSGASPPHSECSVLATFNPTERTRYTGTISVPAIPPQDPWIYRYVAFWRASQEVSETAAWHFSTGGPESDRSTWQFD